jgi:hypothetical protein
MPLSTLERTLTSWLREQLPLPADVGEVSFESPEGTWGASVTRPTVNLFLFDIARAPQQPVAVGPYRDAEGVVVRDLPAQAVSFSYLVSAWGGGLREEHRLLGDAVRAILRTSTLEPGSADGELAGSVQLALSDPDRVRGRELWAGLGGKLRPSLILVATAAVTLDRPQRVAPPVQHVGAVVTEAGPWRNTSNGRRFVWFGASRARERDRA